MSVKTIKKSSPFAGFVFTYIPCARPTILSESDSMRFGRLVMTSLITIRVPNLAGFEEEPFNPATVLKAVSSFQVKLSHR